MVTMVMTIVGGIAACNCPYPTIPDAESPCSPTDLREGLTPALLVVAT